MNPEPNFRVALVVMPFAAATRPSLAAGLLQAGLRREGIDCDTKYFSVTLERMLGPERYKFFCHNAPMTALAGGWAFSQALFGERFSDFESYCTDVLDDPVWGLGRGRREERSWILELRDLMPLFLRLALESNDWSEYDLVGFTSTFDQTLPALALAQRIRERHPEVLLAAGGANFEGEMGRPYLDHFPFLDFISTGEADRSFPLLCRRLAALKAGDATTLDVPAGFLSRYPETESKSEAEPESETQTNAAGQSFVVLEDLPTPSYDDYFQVAAATWRGVERGPVWLPVESSRGCWWGQKAHCTFCGLNGDTMTFRRKSWRRVAEETESLATRHPGVHLQFADNILGMHFFDNLLPHWAEQPDTASGGARKFFEIKSNLRREQVRQLRNAGITSVQAGIENLADGTLRLMRKGVSGAQNVALIRWCVEFGVDPLWNVIYGFPHENLDDYERNLHLLQRMTHLPPPLGHSPIRLDRFSPNFAAWEEHGFTSIEPVPAYRHLLPFPDHDLETVAYYFTYDHAKKDAAIEKGAIFTDLLREWQQRFERGEHGELAVKRHWRGGLTLVDRRFTRRLFSPADETRLLSEAEAALLLTCDAPISEGKTVAAAARANDELDEIELASALERLVDDGVIARAGGRLVTLALMPDSVRREVAPLHDEASRLGEPRLAII